MWWLVWTTALAGPEERIVRLAERAEWVRAHEVCEDNGIHNVGARDIQALCAEAEYRAAPPPDTVPALLAFRGKWYGTKAARIAFSRAAVVALPANGASEAELREHHKQFKGTEAAHISMERAEKVAFLAAREAGTLSALARFLKRYPSDKLHRNARAEALAIGLNEATTTGDIAVWQQLLEVVPGAETEIRAAGDAWRAKRLDASLTGPCWDAPCTALPSQQSIVLDVPELPWATDVRATWTLQRPDGSNLSASEVVQAIGIPGDTIPKVLPFRSTPSGLSWQAPADWAQPSASTDARWVVSISVGDGEPTDVPLLATAHWQTAGPLGEAVAHYSEAGLWIHGPGGSVQWADHSVREGVVNDRLAVSSDHLYYIHDQQLYATHLNAGEPHLVPLEHKAMWFHGAKEGVWVQTHPILYHCSGETCEAVYEGRPKDVHPTKERVLVEDAQEGGVTWLVVDHRGRTLLQHRFDFGCQKGKYCPKIHAAAFDASGRYLLTAGGRGQERILEVLDLQSGSVVGSRSYDLNHRSTHDQMGEYFNGVLPTQEPGEWVLTSQWELTPFSPQLGIKVEESSLQVDLLKDVDSAWYLLGHRHWKAKPGPPRGWSIYGAKVGSRYEVTLASPNGERGVVLSQKFKRDCADQDGRPQLNAMWLPKQDWIAVEPLHGWCETVEWPYEVMGEPFLIRIPDGKVFPSHSRRGVLNGLSPSHRGIVTRTHIFFPGGRVVKLQAPGDHVWFRSPLSMALRVDPSTVPEP